MFDRAVEVGGTSSGQSVNFLVVLQVLEPEPPQTLLPGAGPFVAMPPQRGRSFTAVDQDFAHDVLPVRHHSMVQQLTIRHRYTSQYCQCYIPH